MITEDYVSFEIAKLLKEKGFDEPTTKSYYTEGFENPMIFSHDLLPCIRPDEFLCPTHQMALKWLREVYHIFIFIDYVILTKLSFEYRYEIHNMINGRSMAVSAFRDDYETYEEAVEAAIKYCLEKLI